MASSFAEILIAVEFYRGGAKTPEKPRDGDPSLKIIQERGQKSQYPEP